MATFSAFIGGGEESNTDGNAGDRGNVAAEKPSGSAPGSTKGDSSAGDVSDGERPCFDPKHIAEMLKASGGGGDKGKDTITDLMRQRQELTLKKRKLTALLKNEARKRRRMLAKSSKLTTNDLVEGLNIRCKRDQDREEKQKAEKKGKEPEEKGKDADKK